MLSDLRFGFRMLRKSASSSVLAALSLALGIGAATAIFSVVNAVLFEPFPYKDFDRIVDLRIEPLKKGEPRWSHSIREYLDIREQNRVFEDVFAMGFENLRLTGGAEPEFVGGKLFSSNAFAFLGVKPLLGRTFLPGDYGSGGVPEPVVVLSYLLWQRRFAGDPQVIGQTVRLEEKKHTVIGVMPPRFTLYTPPNQTSIWLPLALDPLHERPVVIHGRLKPGITRERASAELQAIYAPLAEEDPSRYPAEGFRVHLRPFTDWVWDWIRNTVYILMAAIALLLLIACANVANLLLARATARTQEMAVRMSVGASRVDLLRQLLTESVLLSLVGGVLGILLAYWGTNVLVALLPANSLPSETAIRVDGRVLLFSFALSLLTGILFGFAPAVHASKLTLSETLKDAGRGPVGGSHGGRTRNALVISAMAFSMILLIGAGLMIRTSISLYQEKLGFQPENVLTMVIPLPAARYSQFEQRTAFYQNVLERVEAIPGVRAATLANSFPPRGGGETALEIGGRPQTEERKAAFHLVSSGYFRTMGIPLLRGRGISEQDTVHSEHVAVINEVLAARFFSDGEDPVGKRIRLAELEREYLPWSMTPAESDPWCRIVGVAGNAKNDGLGEEPRPAVFVPFTLLARSYQGLAVRTVSTPMRFLKAVRSQVLAVDKDQPVAWVRTLEQRVASETAEARFTTFLFGVFAVVGLVLAGTGIYGVMAYGVSQRTHEIGIRVALGAQNGDVMRWVLLKGLKLVLVGVAVGLLGSVLLSRLVASQLYGVTSTDPLTFFGVAALLTVVALMACYIPARRAAKVDPMVALRHE